MVDYFYYKNLYENISSYAFSYRIINTVEKIAAKLSLGQENKTTLQNDLLQVSTPQVGLALFQQDEEQIFGGGSVKINSVEEQTKSQKRFNFDTNSAGDAEKGTVIKLPKSIFSDASVSNGLGDTTKASLRGLQFVHYTKDTLFKVIPNKNRKKVDSSEDAGDIGNMTVINGVFSVSVGQLQSVKLSEELEFTMVTSLPVNKQNVRCVYWNFSRNGKCRYSFKTVHCK